MFGVKILNKTDLNQFYQLYLAAFNYKNSPTRKAAFEIRYDNAYVYGYKKEDELVGGLWSLPFMVNFFNKMMPMEGIGVVMTNKDYQGQGVADTLLKTTLKDMYKRKTALSYLAPFSYPFYRKYGYEQVFTQATYTIEIKNLPQIIFENDQKNIRTLDFKDAIPDLKEFYHDIQPQNKGGIVRPDWWWEYLGIRHSKYKVLIYYVEQRPASYIVYDITGQNVTIYDWQNDPKHPDSFVNLLGHMSLFISKLKQATFIANSSYYLGSAFADPSIIVMDVKPYMMARIVNLEEFIKLYPFKHQFEVNFNLDDSLIAENNGNWKISYNGNEATIIKKTAKFSQEADFEISIQQLTKLMMGGTQFENSVRIGKIKNHSENSFKFVEALQHEEPELIDYF